MSSFSLSRRGFLGLGGGVALAATLAAAGCSSGDPSNHSKGGGVAKLILPGDVPQGWQAVKDKVNAKLQAELGFTIDPQFINWSNYGQQALLKFTAGEQFDTALQALWLNMAQLQQAGALTNLTGQPAKYSNLAKTIADEIVTANSWDGKLWGIPQVNSAARIHHYSVRQDLAEKVGQAEIASYADFERFLYLIKEKGGGAIPYAAASNTMNLTAVPGPTAQFNAQSWEDPHTIALAFTGKAISFIPAKDAGTTKSSAPIPFWEDPSVVETFHRIRKYYQDGLINKDAINTDSATISSQFAAGKFASIWAITDGLSSTALTSLTKAVPGAQLANVAPFAGGLSAKPNQTFQADNLVVVNARGGDVDRAMKLQDWLSIQENYDLVNYGIEGTDWKAVGSNKFEALSKYSFPGFALAWRAPLYRRVSTMTATEEKLFDWAQEPKNFTVDPFSSFIPNSNPVKAQIAQMSTVTTQYANPLFYGVVDVDPQLDKLKKAAAAAGLDKLQAEMQTQADAYLSKNS
ncbi:MAG TPA: DUF3502 domain-containing protein [Microlunatus sp.]|nr:DUF3502 domain-containing protein [Microlunatus sp.]